MNKINQIKKKYIWILFILTEVIGLTACIGGNGGSTTQSQINNLQSSSVSQSINKKVTNTNSTTVSPVSANVVAVDDNNNIYIGSNAGSVSVKQTNGNYVFIGGKAPDNSPIRSLVASSETNSVFAGTQNGGVYISQSYGAWHQLLSESQNFGAISVMLLSQGNLYIGTQNGYVMSLTVGAESWSVAQVPDSFPVTSLANLNNDEYVGTRNGIYALYYGSRWNKTSVASSINVLTTYNNLIYAGDISGNVYSSSDGVNWSLHKLPNMDPVTGVVGSGDTMFATTTNNVYSSHNNGKAWEPTKHNIPESSSILSLTINQSRFAYVSTIAGNVLRARAGTTWQNVANSGPYIIFTNRYSDCNGSCNFTIESGPGVMIVNSNVPSNEANSVVAMITNESWSISFKAINAFGTYQTNQFTYDAGSSILTESTSNSPNNALSGFHICVDSLSNYYCFPWFDGIHTHSQPLLYMYSFFGQPY